MAAVPGPARELPHDLAVEILLRLPVRSLVRFKSVCKPWRSVIESPGFISRHVSRSFSCGGGRSAHGGRSLVVEYRCPDAHEDRMALLSGQTLELSTPLEAPPHLHSQSWGMVGCCNGVVCLSDGVGYLLWNPAMRHHRILPERPISRRTPRISDGFGYGSALDDCKIVRIGGAVVAGEVCVRAEVFALGEGFWREIQVPASALSVWQLNPTCVSVGGFLYLGVLYPISDDPLPLILSFGLRDEVFGQVRYPDPGLVGHGNHKSLASCDESLCLIVFDYTAVYDTAFDLWVMEGGPGKESWTKRWSIGPVIGFHRPLSCVLNGGILVVNQDGALAICGADNESVRDLAFKGGYCIGCHLYTESLVRVVR